MFKDILEEKKLEHLHIIYKKEGESSAGSIIVNIINKLTTKKDEAVLNLAIDTTVFNIFKLRKQKSELQKGYVAIVNFYDWLEKRGMVEINIANVMISKIRDSLAKEIRQIKRHQTAVLEVIASWGAIFLAIIAIIISLVALTT